MEISNNNFKLIKKVSWEDVFQNWKEHEGSQESWKKVAQEKGFDSWEAWRMDGSKKIGADKKDWELYEITNVAEVIPKLLLGPFQAWQRHFDDFLTATFDDLLQQVREWVNENEGIQKTYNNLPFKSTIVIAYFKDSDELMVLEGHHRCAAITKAINEGVDEKIPILNAYIAQFTAEDKELFRKLLEEKGENKKEL